MRRRATPTSAAWQVLPGDIVFFGPQAELHIRTAAHGRWGAMSLTPEDLATTVHDLVSRDLSAPAVTYLIHPPAQAMERLIRLHKAAGDLATTAPEILAHPEVAKAVEQALVPAMLACLTESEKANTSLLRAGAQVMRKLEHMLEENPQRPIYLAEVCAKVGVSDRVLRVYCQEHLGMGPSRYLWLRRMHLAHHSLAAADPTKQTVTEVANDHGFGELGDLPCRIAGCSVNCRRQRCIVRPIVTNSMPPLAIPGTLRICIGSSVKLHHRDA